MHSHAFWKHWYEQSSPHHLEVHSPNYSVQRRIFIRTAVLVWEVEKPLSRISRENIREYLVRERIGWVAQTVRKGTEIRWFNG